MNIELQQEAAPRRRSRFGLRPLPFETGLRRAAAGGLWIASSAGAGVSALGVPTGLGAGVDVSAAIVLNAAALALAGALFAWLFRILRCPLPPLATSSAAYSLTLLTFVLYIGSIDWPFALLISALYLAIGAGLGLLAAIWFGRGHSWRLRFGSLGLSAVLLGGLGYAAVGNPWEGLEAESVSSDDDAAADTARPEEAPTLADDPSQPGAYAFRAFTYGSGTDRQREEFGSGALLRSAPADASRFIAGEDWPKLRELYWGFGPRELPLNGSMWLPEGDGPFPVVLIVHGNHLMEDYSDKGYAYLGELLASRGFAVVSVDENFLNYSAWSGIPDQDMKVRAWLLLMHIGQLQRFAADESTPFYGKLDFGRIALVGHSRGGQAVAMAADRDQWFGSAPELPAPDSYAIRAVAALAPTDTAVDGRYAWLKDIAYLTLQGAGDGDVSTFDGERQYARAAYSADSAAFKASLYIDGANHGQFNTSWGALDDSLPAGLFLSRPELDGDEQRQVAKTYLSAFLEDTLHGRLDYEILFRDYRAGTTVLPSTEYYGQFENGSFRPIVRYEESPDPKRPAPGVAAEAAGMTSWEHREALDREGNGKANRGVVLRWEEEGGSYALRSDSTFAMPADEGVEAKLMFSLADLTWEMDEDDVPGEVPLRIAVEVADADGHTASVPLDEVMPVLAVPQTKFTWLNGLERALDDGKYEQETEAVFQTYAIALDRFHDANPALNANRIASVTFAFSGEPGQAMLDDIGFGD